MGGVYQRGTPVSLVERFYVIDAVTEAAVLADPTTVTFTVLAPDDTEQTFVWPGSPDISHPTTGIFVCAIPSPPLPPGEYRYLVEGAGAVVATREDSFTVSESGVLAPEPSGVATFGPCSPWIDGSDVALFGAQDYGVGSEFWKLDDAAVTACQILYVASGRQFPGVCTQTVRPCTQTCSCFGFTPSLGYGLWSWTFAPWGGGWGWGWANECGDICGCGSESYVLLAGYPVREISQVKIDGVVLDPSEYRLDQRRQLIRLADLTQTPPLDRAWPACQDLSLPDTEPGTFSITYSWGMDVPLLGRKAAAQLARELWAAENNGTCKLPSRVTRIVRQGITMDKVVPTADLIRAGATGLAFVDAFIGAVNPQGAQRRSGVWSPDLQQFARTVGQD